jgi:hypothetical protein
LITEKQIQAIIKLDASGRYEYSIKKIADYEKVWVLGDDEGFVTYGDNKGNIIFPIWPFKEFALLCSDGEFDGSIPEEITIDSFLKEYLHEFKGKKYLLSVLPLPSDRGAPLDIDTFINDLQNELEKY